MGRLLALTAANQLVLHVVVSAYIAPPRLRNPEKRTDVIRAPALTAAVNTQNIDRESD
jgi:hypothetical protein